MQLKDAQSLRDLIAAKDYRDFLARAFEIARAGKSRFSYAAFARRAGFTARSFPRDVVLGKKRLTYESATRFAEALGLSADLRAYFLSLVAREEQNVRLPNTDERELEKRLGKLRKRVRSRAVELEGNPSEPVYGRRYWLEVYAALGTPEGGATGQQVLERTRLPPARCQEVLDALVAKNIARYDQAKGRYFAGEANVNFQNLGGDRHFRQWYLDCLAEARQRAARDFRSEQALFLNSVFSVARRDLPRFKQELRELVARFVDSAEEPEGDAIAKLSVAMYAD